MPDTLSFESSGNYSNLPGIYNKYFGTGGAFGASSVGSLVGFLNEYFGGGFELTDSGSAAFDALVNNGVYVKHNGQWYRSDDLMNQINEANLRALVNNSGFSGNANTGGDPAGTDATGSDTAGDTGSSGEDSGTPWWQQPWFWSALAAGGSLADALWGGGAAQKDYTKAMTALTNANTALTPSRIALNEAQTGLTGAQTAQAQQTTQQAKYDMAKDFSKNPLRQQGAGIIGNVLSGTGPAQTTLNSFRADNRRTLPNLTSQLYYQLMNRNNTRTV